NRFNEGLCKPSSICCDINRPDIALTSQTKHIQHPGMKERLSIRPEIHDDARPLFCFIANFFPDIPWHKVSDILRKIHQSLGVAVNAALITDIRDAHHKHGWKLFMPVGSEP